MREIRCPVCGRKLGLIDGEASIKCNKCKSIVDINTRIGKVNIRTPKSVN